MRGHIAVLAVVLTSVAEAQTQVGGPVDPQRAERCAVRVGIALTGKSPSAALLSAANPQLEVDALLESDAFIERFARFINTTFNDTPGTNSVVAASTYEPVLWLRSPRPRAQVRARWFQPQAGQTSTT